jgi:hypothetical protein
MTTQAADSAASDVAEKHPVDMDGREAFVAGPAAIGFTSVAVFLFFLAHGGNLFTHPPTFLMTVLTWGVLFGVPLRIFYRNRMYRCLTVLALLFFFAAGFDVFMKHFLSTLPSPSPVGRSNLLPKPQKAIPAEDTTSSITDPETGEILHPETDPFGAAKALSLRGRPMDEPDVRMQMRSTALGNLHGTVHNDTGIRLEKLRLSIETERWKRIHEVKLSVEPNTTREFVVYIGDAWLEVKRYYILK